MPDFWDINDLAVLQADAIDLTSTIPLFAPGVLGDAEARAIAPQRTSLDALLSRAQPTDAQVYEALRGVAGVDVAALAAATVPVLTAGGVKRATIAQLGGAGGFSADHLDAIQALPDVATRNVGDIVNLRGVLYELLAAGVDRHVYHGTIGDLGNGLIGDATFSWREDPEVVRANFSKAALGGAPPATIWILVQTSGGLWAETGLSRYAAGDAVSTYGYQRKAGESGIDSTDGRDRPLTGAFSVTAWSDDAQTQPLAIVPNVGRWAQDARNQTTVSPWAQPGNADPVPPAKLTNVAPWALGGSADLVPRAKLPHVPGTHLVDHEFPGLTLLRTDTSVRPAAPTYLDPAFDLDNADKSHGEFHCALSLSVDPVSDLNMGFVQGKANQTDEDRQLQLGNIAFATALADAGDFVFSSTESLAGLAVFEQPLYSLNTLVGTYRVLLVHNSDHEVGVYHYWEGAAGGTGATIGADLRVTFTPADAASATARETVLATLTNTVNGTLADFNAVRDFINENNNGGAWLELDGEYPLVGGGIADGRGYTARVRFRIPSGLAIPAASNNDAFLRRFTGAASDHSAAAETLSLTVRPGAGTKLSVDNALSGSGAGDKVIRIYGVA